MARPYSFIHTQVNFWRSLDEAMRRVEAQLQSPGVRLTLRILKQARRIIAVAALEGGNTGMDHANKVRSAYRTVTTK